MKRHFAVRRMWGAGSVWVADTTPETVTAAVEPVRMRAEVVHVITDLPQRALSRAGMRQQLPPFGGNTSGPL